MNILQNLVSYITSFFLAIYPAPTYTEGIVGQPQSFLPHQATTQNDKTISGLIYRGLFKYDIYGTLKPDLAETWIISDEGLVYTVKIKEGQRWSNGKEITSDDLIYTAFKVADLSGVATDRVDNYTVRYTLPNKFSPFLSLLTVGVMPSNAEETNNKLVPVSSGHFKVLRVEKDGPAVKKVILYNTNTNEAIKKLAFRFYVNEEELLDGAKLGEIQGFVSSNEIDLENFDDYKFPLQGVYYALYFNLRNENVPDKETRLKMAKSLNIKELIANKGIDVEGAVSRNIYTNTSLSFNVYDNTLPEEALNKTYKLVVPDIETHVELAKKVKSIWFDEMGINIEIARVSPTEFIEKVLTNRDFDILLYGQEVGRDPDRYVNWHSTQSDFPGLNLSGLNQVRADRALEEGRNEEDAQKREVHYHEFQKVINEQVPAIFLYHPYVRYYISEKIEGVGEKYTFTVSDRFLDFFNWKVLRGV